MRKPAGTEDTCAEMYEKTHPGSRVSKPSHSLENILSKEGWGGREGAI